MQDTGNRIEPMVNPYGEVYSRWIWILGNVQNLSNGGGVPPFTMFIDHLLSNEVTG